MLWQLAAVWAAVCLAQHATCIHKLPAVTNGCFVSHCPLRSMVCRCRGAEASHAGAEAGLPDAAGGCLVETASDQPATPGKAHAINLRAMLISVSGSLSSTWRTGSSADTSWALQLMAASCKSVCWPTVELCQTADTADLCCTGSTARLSSTRLCCDQHPACG